MEEFSDVWRRRQACERCRKHKVRCEYVSPADESCIRCQRSGAECITRAAPKRKDGAGPRPHPGAHAAAYVAGFTGPYRRDGLDGSASTSTSQNTGSGGSPGSKIASINATTTSGGSAAAAATTSALGANTGSTATAGAAASNGPASTTVAPTATQNNNNNNSNNSGAAASPRNYFGPENKLSPLRSAVEDGVYTWQEARDFYLVFTSASPPLTPLFFTESTLEEADKKAPVFTICAITAAACSQANERVRERVAIVEPFFSTGFAGSSPTSIDSLVGLQVLCVYCMPYFERGLSRLYIMHAAMVSLCQKFGLTVGLLGPSQQQTQNARVKEDLELCRQYVASCLVGYALNNHFVPLQDVLESLLPLVNPYTMEGEGDGHTEFLTTVYQIYRMNYDALKATTCFEDALSQCRNALQQFHLAENILQSLPPAYAQVAELKMLRMTFLWIVHRLTVDDKGPLNELMAQAVVICRKFTEFFNKISTWPPNPLVPAFGFYCNEDALISLWLLRYLCFAVGLDVDIPVFDAVMTFRHRWQDMVYTNYSARQAFGNMLAVSDLASYQIGELDADNLVSGPGSIENWGIYKTGHDGRIIGHLPMTRSELVSLLKGDEPLGELDNSMSDNSQHNLAQVLRRMMNRLVYNSL